jgi:hypothetical protein
MKQLGCHRHTGSVADGASEALESFDRYFVLERKGQETLRRRGYLGDHLDCFDPRRATHGQFERPLKRRMPGSGRVDIYKNA